MAGRARRFFSNLADAFIPGNAYNSNTGRWNPATAKTGIAGMIADQVVPGGSNLMGMAAQGGLFGSNFAKQLKNENIYNNLADQYGDFRSQLQDYLHSQRVDAGGNPNVSVGQPQFASIGQFAQVPTMPAVEASAPWTGLGTSTGNVFQGGALGKWANGGGAPSGIHYGNGSGAGTGYGAGSIQIAGQGWGGSDAAMGFGLGAQGAGSASAGNFALNDAIAQQRKNRV